MTHIYKGFTDFATGLATSRERLLGPLRQAKDLTFITSIGNRGDELIWAGTRELLRGIPYREVSFRQVQGLKGETALITGSGGWSPSHHTMPKLLREVERNFKRVIIGPSSFDTQVPAVLEALKQTKALVFARERESFRQIRHLCQADLAYDCAFFFDFSPYLKQGEGTLLAYRTERESARGTPPPGNIDISSTCSSLEEWLEAMARYESIETDRAHVMIAGAMLGKTVYYHPSNYHKIPEIADFSLRDFPVYPQRGATYPRGEAHEFAVIIPTTKNREEALIWNLEHLAQHIPDPFTIYVYSDGAGTLKKSRKILSHRSDLSLRILNPNGEISPERVGCGGARYHLLEAAKAGGHRIVASLDDDMQITPGWYQAICKAIDKHPHHSVFGCVIRQGNPTGPVFSSGSEIRFTGDQLWRKELQPATQPYMTTDWTPMGCVIFTREALRPHVQFPRIDFLEDSALFLLFRELGINQTIITTQGCIVHKPVPAPAIEGFRSIRNFQRGAQYVWETFGINVLPRYRSLRGIPKSKPGMDRFLSRHPIDPSPKQRLTPRR